MSPPSDGLATVIRSLAMGIESLRDPTGRCHVKPWLHLRLGAGAHHANLSRGAAHGQMRLQILARRSAQRALARAAGALLRIAAVDGGAALAHEGRDVAVLGVLAAGARGRRRATAADRAFGLAVGLADGGDVGA